MGCGLRQVVPIARMKLGALDVDLILANAVYVLPRLLHRWLLLIRDQAELWTPGGWLTAGTVTTVLFTDVTT
jgi:hypothetical protein